MDIRIELVARIQAGGPEARTAESTLIQDYEWLHHQVAVRYSGGSQATYDDICQGARYGTLIAARTYRTGAGDSINTRVYRYAYGYGTDALRRTSSTAPVDIAEIAESVPTEWDPEALNIRRDVAQSVRDLLPQFSGLDREILERRLLAFDREPLQEMADRWGCAREHVRQRELKLVHKVLPRLLKRVHTDP